MSNYPLSVNCFLAFAISEGVSVEDGEALFSEQIAKIKHPLDWVVALWCAGWMGYKLRASQLDRLTEQILEEKFQGLGWLYNEILYALMAVAPQTYNQLQQKSSNLALTQVQSESQLYRLIPPKPTWAYTLRQLQKATSKSKVKSTEPDYRTIWIVDFDEQEIFCKEQKMGKKGWSKGRKMKWTELLRPKKHHRSR